LDKAIEVLLGDMGREKDQPGLKVRKASERKKAG
jgi:hypothetical protein